MSLAQLNKQFAIPGQLRVIQKNHDVLLLEISTAHAQASISAHGGQVLSFTPAGKTNDMLFISKLARFEQDKAIRGGIPVCWPWFGPDPNNIGPAHGLVRTRQWQIRQTALLADGAIKVILGIRNCDETLAIWPHSFDLSIEITIHQTLTLELISRNTGSHSFELTQALHSYFYVGDSQQVEITGLENSRYIDKTAAGKLNSQQGPVTISQETDRIYTDIASELMLVDPILSRRFLIQSKNSSTVIIWNPWKHKAAAMTDLGDEEYKTMLCIETANAGNEIIRLAPGEEYRLTAHFALQPSK